MTETGDVIDAIYFALPKSLRRQRIGYVDKLQVIYDNYEAVHLPTAVENLIVNEVTDRAIGYMGRHLKRASQENPLHGNLPLGIQSGPAL